MFDALGTAVVAALVGGLVAWLVARHQIRADRSNRDRERREQAVRVVQTAIAELARARDADGLEHTYAGVGIAMGELQIACSDDTELREYVPWFMGALWESTVDGKSREGSLQRLADYHSTLTAPLYARIRDRTAPMPPRVPWSP